MLGEVLPVPAVGRTIGRVVPQPVAEQQVTALPLAPGRADVHLDAQVRGTHHAMAGLADAQNVSGALQGREREVSSSSASGTLRSRWNAAGHAGS